MCCFFGGKELKKNKCENRNFWSFTIIPGYNNKNEHKCFILLGLRHTLMNKRKWEYLEFNNNNNKYEYRHFKLVRYSHTLMSNYK